MVILNKSKINCPFCSEKIQPDAKKCRFCGEWLNKDLITNKTTNAFNVWKKIFKFCLVLIIILAVIEFTKSVIGSNNKKNVQIVMLPTENSLREFATEQYRLTSSGNKEDWIRLYQEFYSPDSINKKEGEDEFVSNSFEHRVDMKNKGLDHVEFIIHSIKINGAIGYVDRTEKPCSNSSCSITFAGPQRLIRKYIYIENKWYMTDGQVLCNRDKPYDMEPEFQRAISLITQRIGDFPVGQQYKQIENCLLVKYASSEKEMMGAEGMFSFHKGQSTDKLEILVSPRYKTKDDLITSILLIHEIDHATSYAVQGDESDCFENEASAFLSEFNLILTLNKEEIDSLDARLGTNASEELRSIKYQMDEISNAKGTTYDEKSLNFVKSIPAYQEQCSKNNKN